MSSNRISRFLAADFAFASAFSQEAVLQSQAVHSQSAPMFGATSHRSGHGTMVLVPSVTLASWQEQVYRLAYQKALADTAPPRHFGRFFSVWN